MASPLPLPQPPLRFKVDEDLPVEVANLFRAAGHATETVFEQRMHGWTDDRLWPALRAEGRSLLTADVSFADARRLSGTHGVGIVLFRLWPESRRGYIGMAEAFLRSFPVDQVPGRIVTVTRNSIRVHDTRPPAATD